MTEKQKVEACEAIMRDEGVMCNMYLDMPDTFEMGDLRSRNGKDIFVFWNELNLDKSKDRMYEMYKRGKRDGINKVQRELKDALGIEDC